MENLLTHKFFKTYTSLLNVDITVLFNELKEKEWTPENFRFYTAVSVMSSSRIEGESLEVDSYVKHEFEKFWEEIDDLLKEKLSIEEVFYFAALIHLVFVKIHPFNDGNGRTGRLLEKWFIAQKSGEKAWYIGSEYYYYQNLQNYYNNLARTGLFYEELNYERALPFLIMLPNALIIKS